MENKSQSHILLLDLLGRVALKEFLYERVYENSNEEISAQDIIEIFEKIIDGTSNLSDDNIDNRSQNLEQFLLTDMNDLSDRFEINLAQTPVNDFSLFIEGIEQDITTDYTIAGNLLKIFKDSVITDYTGFKVSVKYRFLD